MLSLQWEEYMKRRKAKEGVVKDLAGNVIEDTKPSYAVQVLTIFVLLVADSDCQRGILWAQ
jgi:hypothetical protein